MHVCGSCRRISTTNAGGDGIADIANTVTLPSLVPNKNIIILVVVTLRNINS